VLKHRLQSTAQGTPLCLSTLCCQTARQPPRATPCHNTSRAPHSPCLPLLAAQGRAQPKTNTQSTSANYAAVPGLGKRLHQPESQHKLFKSIRGQHLYFSDGSLLMRRSLHLPPPLRNSSFLTGGLERWSLLTKKGIDVRCSLEHCGDGESTRCTLPGVAALLGRSQDCSPAPWDGLWKRERPSLHGSFPFSQFPLPSCCQRTAPDHPAGTTEKQCLGHSVLLIHVGEAKPPFIAIPNRFQAPVSQAKDLTPDSPTRRAVRRTPTCTSPTPPQVPLSRLAAMESIPYPALPARAATVLRERKNKN